MSRFDIISVGSATIDVFAHTDSGQSEIAEVNHQKDVCYPLGAKILIKELHFFTGGGGTNTAVAFSRIGLQTGYLGKIGLDINGDTILKDLSNERVEFLGSRKGISGYSVILDSIHDDRTIFAHKGCNDDLEFKDFKFDDLDTKWFYFSSMLNESMKVQEKISSYAKKRKILIAYNPSLYLVKKGYAYLKKIINNTEVIIFNKEEAQSLLAIQSENMFELLERIYKLGPKIVVITDGSNGVSCFDSYEKKFYFVKPGKVYIVETTGAGDAFASGFIAGLIKGKNISISLKMGMLNAESVIAYLGAKNKLLGPELIAKAENDKRSIIAKDLNSEPINSSII